MVGKISKYIKKPSLVGARKENSSKNAHPKIPPIDETRTLRHIENFYLSANDVLTPLQKYIVGQGPIEITIPDFWSAVLEARILTIINLSMPFDAGGRNPPYWIQHRFPLIISGWKIQLQDSEEVLDASEAIPAQRIVRRIFQAINEESGEERSIIHIHYENWPDNGAPEPLLFHRFLHLVSSIHSVSTSPIFVHCSAGLGRSGTFVTSHSLCKEIHAFHPSTINIPKRIVELRMQRAYMVSTVVQFEAIYDAMRNCAQ
jgi:protein tyrosine phosphatase